ncbi:MAG: hypothetical protein AMXMBFR84_45280 [Candidatus Hydrogenedentota bacterium]
MTPEDQTKNSDAASDAEGVWPIDDYASLGHGDLDALLSNPEAESETPGSEQLLQDDIDRLLAAQMGLEHAEAEAEAEVPIVDRGELDDTLSRAPDDETLAAHGMDDTLVTPQLGSAPFDDSDEASELAKIESLLQNIDKEDATETTAASDEADIGLDQSMVDELLRQAQHTDTAPPEPDIDEIALTESVAPTQPVQAVKPPPEVMEVPSFPPQIDEALLEDLDKPQEGSEAKPPRKRLNLPVAWIQRNGNRAITSLAAGLVAALATYSLLRGFSPATTVDTAPLAQSEDVLVAATVQTARDLMEQGRPNDAATALSDLISANPGPPAPDAAYWLARARYEALPQSPDSIAASAAQNAIDDFTSVAPGDPRIPESLQWKADIYERTNIPLAALDVYKGLIANFANLPALDEILLKASKTALAVDRTPEAFDFLRRLIDEFPGSSRLLEARLLLGDAYAKAGHPEESTTLYKEIAASIPRDRTNPDTVALHNRTVATAYTRLAQLAFDAGDFESAIQLLENRLQTATTADGNEQIYLLLANSYKMAGKPAEAEMKLRELLDFFPENDLTPQAYAMLAEILASQGKQEEAMRIASEGTNRFPKQGSVLKTKATLMEQTGDLRGAAKALIAADESGQSRSASLLAAGRLYRKMGELTDAQYVLEDLLENYPSAPESFDAAVELAGVLHERGKVGSAIERMTVLLESAAGTPRELPVVLAMARTYADLHITDKAAELYKQAAALTSEPDILAESAIALFRAKVWNEGMAVAERVDTSALAAGRAYTFEMAYGQALLRLDADRGVQLMELAYNGYPDMRAEPDELTLFRTYLSLDRTESAQNLLEGVKTFVEKNPIALPRLHTLCALLGDYHYRKGNYKEAAETFALAQGSDVYASETTYWAQFQRANALNKLGQWEECLALYDKVAAAQTEWSDDAKVRADVVRLEQRLKAGGRTPAANAVG